MTLEGKQILLVDRPADAEATSSILRHLGVRVSIAADATSALALARREEFDMAMIGVGLGDGAGGDPLERLSEGARVPSILMLANPDEARRAIEALSRGASDYLLKPLEPSEVVARVERLLRWQEQELRTRHLQHEVGRRYLLDNVVSLSPGMQRVREQVLQVAPARSTVLIQGESGVGKELVAKAIHYNSPRRTHPFIAINCSAIPVTLIESELFGHERGAFTGAVERQRGKFELAHGGTIFLDEIGEMDLQTQSRLLRVLEEREFMRVGGSRSVRVDVRVLAATNREIRDLIMAGRFREDLYFRLNVITIRVPPLRRRVEDIPTLARTLIDQICRDNGLPPRQIDDGAIAAFLRYPWPGNVRELKNVLESTAITRPGSIVQAADLADAIRGQAGEEDDPAAPIGTTLAQLERELIVRTLGRHGGNRSRTARVLGIGVRTLQRKIAGYGIRLRATRGRPRRDQKSAETPSPGSSPASMKPSRRRTPPRATSS
ncbi:MAG TPA: sigma-54 dependent transcriptional regulator [Patescibacteria group bacterium]|nr:sigma-54 dependent transcriptional regulator [Patescibacteria group bacterium]